MLACNGISVRELRKEVEGSKGFLKRRKQEVQRKNEGGRGLVVGSGGNQIAMFGFACDCAIGGE